MESLKGHLLVASPHLLDPNFVQTVVLLIEHTEEGAFGVVLNRPAENTVQELWAEVSEGAAECNDPRHVHLGGPVSGPLIALHRDRSFSEMEIVPGVHFSAQRENLEGLLAQHKPSYRLFVGHSGWGGGQLENELEQGSWLTTRATADFVFRDDGELWKHVTQQIGRSILSATLHLKHIPPDPSAN